jgi:bacteriocin biosynthesis cyclodehydratase domain-containing protein
MSRPADAPAVHRQRLGIRPSFQARAIPGEGLFLARDGEAHIFEGDVYADLLPALDGSHDREALLTALEARHRRELVSDALDQLVDGGFIAVERGDHSDAAAERAFWDALDGRERPAEPPTIRIVELGEARGEQLRETCASLVTPVVVADHEQADLDVVLTDDYLSPELSAINAAMLEYRRPWLLAKTAGRELWVGPLLRGSPCWACLAFRLRMNRQVETYVSRRLPDEHSLSRSVGQVPHVDMVTAALLGLEILKWSAGGQRAISGIAAFDLATLRCRFHPLSARPQCPDCGRADLQERTATVPVEVGFGQPGATTDLERLRGLAVPLTGVVSAVQALETGLPSVHYVQASFGFGCNATRLASLKDGLLSNAIGTGPSAEVAELRAICEALERYSGMWQGDEPSIHASLQQIDPLDAIHPNACMLYSEAQYDARETWNQSDSSFAFVPRRFEESYPLDWSGVWSLTERRFKLLPTTYLYYHHPQPAAGPFCWADSNGCAAGVSIGDAVYRGLCELVERDAVALWWYNRTRRPGVDLSSFNERPFAALAESHSRLGRELWALDITSDLDVPTFVAVSRRVDRQPEEILLGFGADPDPASALDRAINELNHLLPAVQPLPGRPGEYVFQDRAHHVWWTTARVQDHRYLLPDDGRPLRRAGDYGLAPAPGKACLDGVRQRIESRSLEILVLDQTRPDTGVPVVKCIVPGLRHFWARFAPGRLFDVPVELGQRSAPCSENELNPIPLFA